MVAGDLFRNYVGGLSGDNRGQEEFWHQTVLSVSSWIVNDINCMDNKPIKAWHDIQKPGHNLLMESRQFEGT